MPRNCPRNTPTDLPFQVAAGRACFAACAAVGTDESIRRRATALAQAALTAAIRDGYRDPVAVRTDPEFTQLLSGSRVQKPGGCDEALIDAGPIKYGGLLSRGAAIVVISVAIVAERSGV